MGAIQFIENLDRTSLTVSDDEFEKKVELAVSEITEGHRQAPFTPPHPSVSGHVQISEKGSLSQPEVARNSIEADYRMPLRLDANSEKPSGRGSSEDNDPVNGLLRTIQRPLSSLGKIFNEDSSSSKASNRAQALAPPPQSPRTLSPALVQPPRDSDEIARPELRSVVAHASKPYKSTSLKAEDAAARQASAEAAEAQRIQQAEHNNVVE